MSKFRRVLNVLSGIGMILVGALLMLMDTSGGLRWVLLFIQIGMTFRGLGSLYYYLKMARYMVGGRSVLYRGMIYLDLGVLAGSLFDHPVTYTVIYLAAMHVFAGAVRIMRARESMKIGGHWRLKMAYGVTGLLLAAAVVAAGVVLGRPEVAAYVYGAGLIYSAILRIAGAFRRTDIVYIQ
ncbi:MAG: hypothetical protein IJH92_01395 [Mogibacterium sp.]|nr:hypothetical protein [Mogibacterium sp.]